MSARLIAGGGDDAASFTTDRNGTTTQPFVSGLLCARKERIRIAMENHDTSFLWKTQQCDQHALNHQFTCRDEIGIIRV